jgi:3D (Asp-Asp-Asp) domain-containing protein
MREQQTTRAAAHFLKVAAAILFFFFEGHALARTPAAPRPHWVRSIATAYAITGQTASQTYTQEGRTLAADPNILPIGTVVEIRDAGPYSGECMVEDTGRKILGRHVDIYIPSTPEAIEFGKQRVKIRVVRPAPDTAKERRRVAAEATIEPRPLTPERLAELNQ